LLYMYDISRDGDVGDALNAVGDGIVWIRNRAGCMTIYRVTATGPRPGPNTWFTHGLNKEWVCELIAFTEI
jgi:hypothetical protein